MLTRLQMLKELDRCFQLALEGGLTAAEKNSLDTRFYDLILHLQAGEVERKDTRQHETLAWATK